MQKRETCRGLLDEYDRLVSESRARVLRSRDLDRLIDQFRWEAADLAERVRQLAHWRDQRFAGFLTQPLWLN